MLYLIDFKKDIGLKRCEIIILFYCDSNGCAGTAIVKDIGAIKG